MIYMINFLLIVFSGFYLTGILSISPIYVTTIVSIILITINILYRGKVYLDKITWLCLIIILYLFITQTLSNVLFKTNFSYVFNYIYIILLQQTIFLIDTIKFKKILNYYFKFNILLLIVELIVRLINLGNSDFSKYQNNKFLYYYALKFNSIMYMDTNYVAMFILVILMVGVYLNFRNFKILILKLIFLSTCCKSAIGIYYMKNIRKYWIIVIPILGLVISLIIKDPNSLLIRFHILIEYINYLKNAQWQKILFGIGLGNSLNVIGIGAHNIFITNFLELGLIGSLFNFILCYFFYKKSKKILLILIPFLIAGVIFAPTSTPYLYTAFFIIIRLEKNKELE